MKLSYTQSALDWAQSEDHAKKLLKACRFGIKTLRQERKTAEAKIFQQMDALNAIKAKALENGWNLEDE